MKTRSLFVTAVALGLAGSLSLGTFRVAGDISVGVQINAVAEFHAPLAPHGVWVDVGHYGRCWRPSGIAVGWRPYCDGHWEWTDCGWYWISDEPWAWATYHYGSWVFDSGGWIWVPGVEWAPAWVSWRVGGGHFGWAPCAPRGVIVAPSLFVFVDGPRFGQRITPQTVIVNNTTIINQTTPIAEVKRETRTIAGKSQQVVVNEGPGAAAVEKVTGKKLAALPVQEVDRKTSVPAEVKRRSPESTTKEAAPTKQDQKKSTPDTKADKPAKTAPTEKPDRKSPQEQPQKPDRASPPDKPNKTPPAEKPSRPDRPDQPPKTDKPDRASPPDKPDRASPPDKPDRAAPPEKSDKPDRAAPDKPSQPDRAAPPPSERPGRESPPSKSPGGGKERGGKGGKEKGPRGTHSVTVAASVKN